MYSLGQRSFVVNLLPRLQRVSLLPEATPPDQPKLMPPAKPALQPRQAAQPQATPFALLNAAPSPQAIDTAAEPTPVEAVIASLPGMNAVGAPNRLAAPPTPPPAPPAPAAPKVELPSTDASYLQNPSPAYPVLSKRLKEQGQVVLRVLVSADGRAERVEIKTSSGHERLDAAAQRAVSQWRFVPGSRGGVPEAMWFVVPVDFALN